MPAGRENARTIALLVSILAMIGINILANAVPFGGFTTGAISARYPTVITPASYAFLIWSAVYIALAAFGIWQALPAQRERAILKLVRGPLLVSCAANILWIFCWHSQLMPLSLVMIALLLASLTAVYVRIDREPVQDAAERWLLRVPLSVYFGWVLVATAVNAAVAFTSLNFRMEAPESAVTAGVFVLFVVGVIATVIARVQADSAFTATVLWAMIAIAVAQWQAVPGVAVMALLVGFVVLVARFWEAADPRRLSEPLRRYATAR